ncbi:tetratricopeptide repeat protein [Bifidobacterium vespertilionis]|uniref:tetratricopeptide repeat protein n=1 Tax=Bifidobacterium vespertilionis TaxID=2562524 RepID=UPI001BDC648C|nr:tetratricopeptide repeat protein [Bifidobacterium vespertilionis]MBT1178670.1 tetratricopeptide repeat protein [Bifidobacterium vespertilionis]
MSQKPQYMNIAGLRHLIDRLRGHSGGGVNASAFSDALESVEAKRRGGGAADMVAELTRHSRPLGPLIKRHVFDHGIDGVPAGLKLGWAQLPELRGRGFSLGVFCGKRDANYAQIAFADDQGRVFVTTDPKADVHDMSPRFMLGKEGTVKLPYGRRFGKPDQGAKTVEALTGSVAGRDDNGRMNWLASWLKVDGRYTLEQMRPNLPDDLRYDLEYRDAIAIAFFSTYMLPQIHGLLIGFGSGNIFRRLNREAPIGAIRRSVRDTLEARSKGMRASGLEDHFADLMREAGALGDVTGLEAVHGAEPLHLYTSSYSGGYFFGWDSSLAFPAALKSLKIEGNLNRFASVSSWLERNASIGAFPTEDTVTRAEAAQIDQALLANPALIALGTEDYAPDFDPVHDNGVPAAWRMVDVARRTAAKIREANPSPFAGADGATGKADGGASEWVYRQTLGELVRRLRLPYRFDVEFRSNLAEGTAALGFTTAGTAMMPSSRYDEAHHQWVQLSDAVRAQMSAAYNLRVGLIMAALSFGADERVREVSLRIDSIGLEEAVAEQDSAISEMMQQALATFERMRAGSLGAPGPKAGPKDGDIHGDPSQPLVSDDDPSDEDGDDKVNAEFRSLMQGADLDETLFASPAPGSNTDSGEGSGASGLVSRVGDEVLDDDDDDMGDALDDDMDDYDDQDDDSDDPMAILRRNPSVRNLVNVTFQRDRFLEHLRLEGLEHPLDFYRMFRAVMEPDARGELTPVTSDFDLSDARFAPHGSQEEPELSTALLDPVSERILGCEDTIGLAIQREDLLQRAVADFHRIAADESLPSVSKAQHAMAIVNRLADPELTGMATQVTSALIDGKDTPELAFDLAKSLDRDRLKARDQLFNGQTDQAIETIEASLKRMDDAFAAHGVPRYFNSYAERVVYNRLFATPGETTVLIPDNLFYAHMELADVLAQIKGAAAALPHLNRMVSYAPAYPLSHMRLSLQLARNEDWDSARAACLNALRVSLDRDDAAFAYYRFAYAAWMRDEFDVAAAAYIMSDHISSGAISALEGELQELVARADSQCVPVPRDVPEAQQVLRAHDLPVWPHTEVAAIVREAARATVDRGMFVPARTLTVAAARMNDGDDRGVDAVQAQFLRSLNA